VWNEKFKNHAVVRELQNEILTDQLHGDMDLLRNSCLSQRKVSSNHE